ncbi:MAG: substrate-binding domain-containing protein [Anaerolineae bacterium]|nr:substrate-binding domain-containing protein [Anaerolineae bacterium]
MKAQSKYGIREQKHRPTIGLLVTWLRDGYENGFMLGVADAAAALDANLICFVGGELRWEAPQNVVFDLLTPEKFDGLIISGTLGHAISPEKLQEFCARFAPLPLVGGALPVPGVVQVLPDSFSGMREAVEHLVTVHGCRHIAFIQGPAGQVEAEDRFRAYTEVLERQSLPLDPALIAAGDYRRVTGEAAMEELLARHVPIDAVVTANDDMAFGAFDVLRAHGLRVPEDIALVGFDDVDAAQHLETPLTTVRQSFAEAARMATETLLALIRGEETPAVVHIPTRLVLRRSCGCQLESVTQAAVPLSAPSAAPSAWGTLPAPETVPESLWGAFWADVNAGESRHFLPALESELRRIQPGLQSAVSTHTAELDAWTKVISDLRRAVLPNLVERAPLLHAETLLQQARVLAGAASQRLEGYRELLLRRQETNIQEFDRALAAALAFEDLKAPVANTFPVLGIGNSYLALYADGTGTQDRARLIFSYEPEQGPRVWEPEVLFPSRQLFPEGMALEAQRYTAILSSLVMRDSRLGFMLFEFGPREGAIYDRLGEQFSGSIFRMLLLQQQAEVQSALEESRQSAETALRDLLVLQRRYVREAWESHAAGISGYTYVDGALAEFADSTGGKTAAIYWLPAMTSAVESAKPAQHTLASGSGLAMPLMLYGEVIGVLGLEREGEQPWTAEQITLIEGVLEQTARALETQRLVTETRHRAAQLRTATEIAQITSSILSLEVLEDQSVNLLRDRFGYYYVGLFLVDSTGRWAVLRAGTGEAGEVMLGRSHRLEVGGASMIGQCVAENAARIALDVGAEAVRFDNPLLPETRSELAVPLRSRGRAIGAMTIQSVERMAFSEEDIAVLQTVADQLGNAIETVRLLGETEKTVHALEAAQGTYTQESWRAYLETVGKQLGYRYRLGLESAPDLSSEEQAALEQQQPVVTRYVAPEDAANLPSAISSLNTGAVASRAAVALPLRLREQTIGALNVRFEDEHVPPETMELLEQVAEQLTQALESARLYQATQQQAAQERLISEATSRMRERMDVDAVLQTAVRELQQVLGLRRVEVRMGASRMGALAADELPAPEKLSE